MRECTIASNIARIYHLELFGAARTTPISEVASGAITAHDFIKM